MGSCGSGAPGDAGVPGSDTSRRATPSDTDVGQSTSPCAAPSEDRCGNKGCCSSEGVADGVRDERFRPPFRFVGARDSASARGCSALASGASRVGASEEAARRFRGVAAVESAASLLAAVSRAPVALPSPRVSRPDSRGPSSEPAPVSARGREGGAFSEPAPAAEDFPAPCRTVTAGCAARTRAGVTTSTAGRTTNGDNSAGVPSSPAASAALSTCPPKIRSNAMPCEPPGCADGSVLMTSPIGLSRALSSASPLSKSDKSNAARTRHSATPRRTFSRSRCSSYSVKTERTCASSSSRSSGSSSDTSVGAPSDASRAAIASTRPESTSVSEPRAASPSSAWNASSASISASSTAPSSSSFPRRRRSSRSSVPCASREMRS